MRSTCSLQACGAQDSADDEILDLAQLGAEEEGEAGEEGEEGHVGCMLW